jgi:hypothetical protein
MSFRERLARFWSRILAWARLRRSCVLCGYGLLDVDPDGEAEWPEVRVGSDPDGNRWRCWVHASCHDNAEPAPE